MHHLIGGGESSLRQLDENWKGLGQGDTEEAKDVMCVQKRFPDKKV